MSKCISNLNGDLRREDNMKVATWAYMIMEALSIEKDVVVLYFQLAAILWPKQTFVSNKIVKYLEILLQQLRDLCSSLIRLLPLQHARIAGGNANLPRRRHCRSSSISN